MSWLNFNDSLNNLKGQITNFATNVLADNEEVGNNIHDKDVEELKKICVRQELEINNLKKFNQELTANFQNYKQNVSSATKQDESWDNWSVQEETTSNSQTSLTDQIKQLEAEKQELVLQLDQLDADHQQTISSVLGIKSRLQDENSDLKREVNELKEEINAFKSNKKNDGYQEKYETLLRDFHKVKEELEESKKTAHVLDSSNKTLQKVLEDTKSLTPSNDAELESCKKRIERLENENKLLLVNFQKAKETLTEYEQKTAEDVESYKKLSNILENYQEQVTTLKADLKRVRASNDGILKENEAMHKMYVNILTENMKKYVECKSPHDFQPIEQEDTSSLKEFTNQVENIVKILLDFKFKSERLEKDLCELSEEKNKILSLKNHEIEKLMHNSEALSQELMSKTGALKQYEKECTELIDNNDMLVTELESMKSNSGLQTISESNEDNLLLLESQLENANKRIEDLEKIVDELEKLKEVGGEVDALKDLLKNKDEDYKVLLETYDKLQVEHKVLKNEFNNNSKMLEDIKSDYENTEYKLSEVDVNLDSLREENESFKKKIDALLKEKEKLQILFTESDESNGKLREELLESRKKCLEQEEICKKQEHEVEQLIEKLKNCKVSETTIKLQYDTLNKEHASLLDVKSSLEIALQETNKNLEGFQENFMELQQQNEKLEKSISEKQSKLDELEEKFKTQGDENQESDTLRKLELAQKQLDELNVSRNELIALVNTKHQECITYHNEIQRLSQLLASEVEKYKQLQLQLDQQSTTHSKEMFTEKDQQIEALSEENSFLKGKCDVLAKNLLEEQAKLPRVLAECSEKELVLTKNLERLQSHLIEVEEHYTQELLQYEQKNAELQAKVGEIEQREKNSSTMYTSVSIRANQQVEVLQNQVQILKNQREEAMKKLSDCEDENNKKAAALANLQFVLEQFQKDREKDVRSETERIRRQIATEKTVQDELKNEIQNLKMQLEESKQGLKAASRLSDQLEQSKKLVTTLKDEVNQLQEKLEKSETKLKSMSSQTDGKVDKSLVKNLLIGYICSNNNNNMNKDQIQVLKIIATVLDFNQQDHDKVNLNKPQGGSNSWWGSFLTSQSGQGMSQESLSQAFIKFLENESKPRIVPSLLDTASGGESKQSTPRQSPHTLSEIVLPTFADFAQSRNSSSILKDVLKDNSV